MLHLVSFHSVPVFLPPARLWRDPFSRVSRARARPRLRAFRGGARPARLVAPARAARVQGARLPSVPSGFFRVGADAEGEAARGCRFLLSHPITELSRSRCIRKYYHNFMNNALVPALPPANDPPDRTAFRSSRPETVAPNARRAGRRSGLCGRVRFNPDEFPSHTNGH